MVIIEVNEKIKEELRNGGFDPLFLDSFLNSKFLAAELDNQKIIGASFVGGLLNVTGIEIKEECRGKGIGKKLLSEMVNECKKRKISFVLAVFKPTNAVSIKINFKIGFQPVFMVNYNKKEGKELVMIIPFNKKGVLLMNLLKIFNTRIGNIFFSILIVISRPLLKKLLDYSSELLPKIDFFYSIKNFEKVQKTLEIMDE